MAYLPSLVDEEADNPKQTRESGVISGSSVAARPSAAPSKSGYTNVGDYITANKEGIGNLANQLTGAVSGQAEAAGTALRDIENEFGGASNVGDYEGITSAIKSGGTAGLTDAQRGQARQFATGNYGGPTSLSETGGYGKAMEERKKALNLVGLAGEEYGTGNLIKEVVKPQNYGRGEVSFDSALLGTAPESREKLQALNKQYSGMGEDLGKAEGRSSALGAARRGAFGVGQGMVKTAAQSAFGNLRNLAEGESNSRSDMASRLKTADTDKYKQEAIDYIMGKYGKTPEQLDPKLMNYINVKDARDYNVDPFDTLNQGQQSEYRSLADILGVNPDFAVRGTPPRNVGNYGFDRSAYDAAVTAQKDDTGPLENRTYAQPQLPTNLNSFEAEALKNKHGLDPRWQDVETYTGGGPQGPIFGGNPLEMGQKQIKGAAKKLRFQNF